MSRTTLRKYLRNNVQYDSDKKPIESDGTRLDLVGYDEDGTIVDKTDTPLSYGKLVVVQPDNSEGVGAYDISAQEFPLGTTVLVKDIHGATANNITVTPEGSFIDPAGVAVDQVVIDTDDGFALMMVAGGITVILAHHGVDLEA